jgi:DsbC/DsbD-like thiol-disulfide interchange protein
VRYLIASTLASFAVAVTAAQDLTPAAAPAHITVTTSVATPAPELGGAVKLYVDVTPQPKIHVYAPGAADYQPIKVTVDAQPGITIRELHYPKAGLLVNEFEKVPVYDKPFRLVQDVTVPSKPSSGKITVTGKVEYQACDDEVCYKPATIPISWQIPVRR